MEELFNGSVFRNMAQIFSVHPQNPQPRLIAQAADLLRNGGLLAIPTDSGYAVVARLDDKSAADDLRRLRGLTDKHHLTLLCRDLAEIGHLAKVDNSQYRLLKAATPGPWTFILEASREVPRRVSHPSRKTIGIRVPSHTAALALLESAQTPLISASLIPQGETDALTEAEEIEARYSHQLAGIIDAGVCPSLPTTVIDMSGATPVIERLGQGDPTTLGLAV